MIELHLSVADLANTRFALSPLWEVTASVRVLRAPGEHLIHRRWVRSATERLRGVELRPLLDLIPVPTRGLPAFLAPPPATSTPDLATELAAMRSIGPDEVRSGLAGLPPSRTVERFGEDVDAGMEQLAAAIEAYWEAALAPWWPRVRTLCEHDLTYRSRLLAEGGAQRLFADLAPQIAWDASGTLRIDNPLFDITERLGGRGLLLVPTVFGGDRVFSVVADPWQPTVRYTPRGLGLLWRATGRQAAPGLADVMGRTRAALLTALDEPAGTGELAERCGLSPRGRLPAVAAAAPRRTGHTPPRRSAGPLRPHHRRGVAARRRGLSRPRGRSVRGRGSHGPESCSATNCRVPTTRSSSAPNSVSKAGRMARKVSAAACESPSATSWRP